MLNEQTHAEMREIGGQDQIPFLVDTRLETTLYGDDDIVDASKHTTDSVRSGRCS